MRCGAGAGAVLMFWSLQVGGLPRRGGGIVKGEGRLQRYYGCRRVWGVVRWCMVSSMGMEEEGSLK